MKASIEQTELLKSMARVQSIVERRTTIPILSNVLLEAKESFLYLRTTDLDIEVLDKVSADVETQVHLLLEQIHFMRLSENYQTGLRSNF